MKFEREGKCHKFILKIKMSRHWFKWNLRQAIHDYDYVHRAFVVFKILGCTGREGGHVETTHKLLFFTIRIRVFVRINLRYIRYKMTRLVWLTKCPYVPPSFALGHKHCKLEGTHSISFFLRSLRPREVVPTSLRPSHHQIKPYRHQIFTWKCSPGQESTDAVQDF